MMYAEVGFQAIRLSFRGDATLFLFIRSLRRRRAHRDRAAQEALLRDEARR